MDEKLTRYEEALLEVVDILQPLGYICPQETCAGCSFERNEALQKAMNALAGLKPDAHYWEEEAVIERAYAAIGFRKKGDLWGRP